MMDSTDSHAFHSARGNSIDTTSTETSIEQAQRLATVLAQRGRWFTFEPLPGARCKVIVKDDESLRLIAQELAPPEEEQQAKCPKCGFRGGLLALKDAYVNHPIPADGAVDWDDHTSVSTFDHTEYECTECNESVREEDIEAANDFTIH